MTAQLLSIWLVVASGVQLGTLWIMKTSILPLLDALPYERYVTTCQLIDMHVFHPIALWNGVIAAAVAAGLAVTSPGPLLSTLFAVGSASMLAVGLASEGVNRPIWRQIELWSTRRTASRWAEKRRTWHVAHEFRTLGALVGAASFAASAAVLVLS